MKHAGRRPARVVGAASGKRAVLLLLLGGLVVGAGAVAVSSRGPTAPREGQMQEWILKVIRRVSAHEGRPDSLNRNLDGAGLSYGVLQWTQRGGNLGKLLAAMQAADPDAFAQVFGPSWARVLDVARRGSLEAVDGATFWQEPWASRFAAAGRHPAFVQAQWSMAAQGEHFRGAEAVAAMLGVKTERAMTLFFDRSVQQGPTGARRVAEQLLRSYAQSRRTTVNYTHLLRDYATFAAAKYRRTTAPASAEFTPGSTRILWKQVGSEWHAVTGPFDLFVDITRRTSAILADPSLSDSTIVPSS